jgi:hypothetical protein
MKTVWIAIAAVVTSTTAFAQSTIYKHVDENGRITYTNRPMKGAVVMELDPITQVPGLPPEKIARALPSSSTPAPAAALPDPDKPQLIEPPRVGSLRVLPAKLEVVNPDAKVIALPLPASRQTMAAVEPTLQRRRDGERRKILEDELKGEEESLTGVRASITQEQLNPQLVAAVRAMQQADNPTPTQMAELRGNIDKASGRIRGLQATAAEHEKNIEALKKELGALKP